MKRAMAIFAALTVGALLAAGGFYAGRSARPMDSPSATAPASTASAGERKVLYWHDPMVPGPRFDKPGKSPFMDMQLEPVYADSESDTGTKVSAAIQQNLGVRTATASTVSTSTGLEAVGSVQFDERLSIAVQTRVAGYVEQLAVRAPMERVRKGQVLATLYAPEWLAPQNELLALQRAGAAPELVAAARDRIRAMSIPESLVRQSEERGVAQARFTLSAPTGGVVAELGVREGVAVTPGTTLFRIAGLEKVWVVAEVPEAQAVHLRLGQKVKAWHPADSSLALDGALKEILPQVSPDSRTLQARFEVDNKTGRLVPGMLMRLQLAGQALPRLMVPSEAVIRTGARVVVIVRKDGGVFDPREVRLGVELGDQMEVLKGLREGEEVVVSGQFLIDSEARLKSVLGAMSAATPASAPPSSAGTSGVFQGEGKVESVEAGRITISHGPVVELKWPAMSMGFVKTDPKAFADIRVGDVVRFEFKQGADPTEWELVRVQRTGGAK